MDCIGFFKNYLEKYKAKHIEIVVPNDVVEQVNAFVRKIVEVKKDEAHHQKDYNSREKRFYTGFLGEAALEILFGVKFIDWSVGDSVKYFKPDLKGLGLNVGIKTVEIGKFPVIFKKADVPEIINIKTSENTVVICGLATLGVLQKYQDENFILDPLLRSKGTKTAFVGLHALKTFRSVEELRRIIK